MHAAKLSAAARPLEQPPHPAAPDGAAAATGAASGAASWRFGSITRVNKAFGFIRPTDSALDVFFHLSAAADSLQGALHAGAPVQFTTGRDERTGRTCATAIRPAPPDAVQHEHVSEQDSVGFVLSWPSTAAPKQQAGVLRCVCLRVLCFMASAWPQRRMGQRQIGVPHTVCAGTWTMRGGLRT